MSEEYRFEVQNIRPHGDEPGFATPQEVKIRIHRCRGAFCLECGEDWRPALLVRPMTPEEIASRSRPSWPEWVE